MLINGAPTDEFTPSRGLRQGDPLSPLLFDLGGEVLSKLLSTAKDKKIFSGIKLPESSTELTHLQYADDVILFIENDIRSIRGVKRVLQYFELLSGLHINFHKSCLYGFGDSQGKITEWADLLGCEVGTGKLSYLGTEIGTSPGSIKYWDPLISRVRKKLQSWDVEHVSLAGRIVLLKASIDSLPVFWLSLFKLPVSVLNSLEKLRRSFLWGENTNRPQKIHLLNWDSICWPKGEGGLGLVPLKLKNLAMLAKWWWRAYYERATCWNKTMVQRYGHDCNFDMRKVSWKPGGHTLSKSSRI